MRILILGGGGMLGHEIWRQFHQKHETWVTVRKALAEYTRAGLFDPARALAGLDVTNMDALHDVFRKVRPEAVINCIGVIKQLKEANDSIISLTLNSLLPHRLSRLCEVAGARLLHISTDCVFSGRKGNYNETDVSDAEDLYGRTKFLGEIYDSHCLTMRTSIIGFELGSRLGLLDWFLGQEGKAIKGYTKAIYTGFSTMELTRIIERQFIEESKLSGLWQISSNPISKHDLLLLARDAFNIQITVEPENSIVCDRSLDSTRFRAATSYHPPSWPSMLEELAQRHASGLR